ncbi:MAG: methionine--tRNA ligase subunit beta, partial [Paramuribaculum sp.]|nr:methionine--tRNA ligase subunit beta [Paramuribaculum sp.]
NGVLPEKGKLDDIDRKMMEEVEASVKSLGENLDTFHFREALKDAMELARIGNRYLQETEPWKVAKTDMTRVATILNCAIQLCANLAVAFEPFMPFMSAALSDMLGLKTLSWSLLDKFDIIPADTKIGEPVLLFEKIEDNAIQAQLDRLERIKQENKVKAFKAAPQAADVDFDTFMKADLRVGTVLECEKVPKADKLLKFKIDDGLGTRTIVSGIAAHYKPETLVGKQVCFIANLPPRKLKGIESQGMILSAENADGSLVVIGPTGPVVPGAQVK